MPYTASGERPDIWVNSISIFTRKTIGYLLVLLLTTAFANKPMEKGALRLLQYKIFDQLFKELETPEPDCPTTDEEKACLFDIGSVKYCQKLLAEALDFSHGSGKYEPEKLLLRETMYSPITKQPYEGKMTFGFLSYSRLRQISSEKISVRFKGQNTNFVNQAIAGRARNGGIRIGEMESEAIKSYGASKTYHEILDDPEEKRIKAYICDHCGNFARHEKSSFYHAIYCEICHQQGLSTKVNPIYLTKAAIQKTLFMRARGIKVTLTPKEFKPTAYISSPAFHKRK